MRPLLNFVRFDFESCKGTHRRGRTETEYHDDLVSSSDSLIGPCSVFRNGSS